MLFYARGSVHLEFVPSGQSVIHTLYLEALRRVHCARRGETNTPRYVQKQRAVVSSQQSTCAYCRECQTAFDKKDMTLLTLTHVGMHVLRIYARFSYQCQGIKSMINVAFQSFVNKQELWSFPQSSMGEG